MSRFFFHVDDGSLLPDTTGTELVSQDRARAEAVRLAGAMLEELDGQFWDHSHGATWTLHVTDHQNRLLFSLHVQGEVPSGDVIFKPT